jgi:hypothetical protein
LREYAEKSRISQTHVLDSGEEPMFPNHLARLTLPGTVALPSPFPTLGILSSEEVCGKVVISIRYDCGDHYTIIRKVFLTDVSAVYFADQKGRYSEWLHLRGSANGSVEFRECFESFSRKIADCEREENEHHDGDSGVHGIIFVPEAVPVMNQVEFGTTAADSAAYYPPTDYVRTPYCTGGCDPRRPVG